MATSWPTLMEDTLAGKFDLAICGITVNDARKEQALMSNGYLENGKTVLCRAEDADRYTSLDAINRPEVRVMMTKGCEDLLVYVNVFLEAEKASGRIDELAEAYIYRADGAELDEAA